jgi:DNA-binding PadR family transcriptional regulator
LEQEGWVKSHLEDTQNGEKGPGRKVYRITNVGQELSNKMLFNWAKSLNLLFKMLDKRIKVFDDILNELEELKKYIDI